MGLNCSGDLASLSFYVERERPFIMDPAVRQELTIKFYRRYADDIFMIVGRASLLRVLRERWEEQARRDNSSFTINGFQASLLAVNVLDLTVFKQGTWLSYCPHIKPTSLGVPLHSTSAQISTMHASWPIGYLFRLAKNSACYNSFAKAQLQFVDRLERFHMDPDVIKSVAGLNAFGILRRSRAAPAPAPAPATPNTTWLVMASHPVWHKASVAKAVAEHISDPFSQALWQLAAQSVPGTPPPPTPLIRSSWKNCCRHLHVRLRK